MGKIVFFEDKNFQGRSYDNSADCPDLRSYFSRCNSIKVENGCWALFEHPNYTGYQYILSPGEYPDCQKWMGFDDIVKSCRCVKNVYGKRWKMRFFNQKDFDGQAVECIKDCASVYESFKLWEFHSCVVIDGAWVLWYDQPNYRGHQYFLEYGEYHSFTDWGAASPTVGSFRMITEF